MKSNRLFSLFIFCILLTSVIFLSGCRKSEQVNYNISIKADNFEIYRKITVVNVRNNEILYELEGFFSLDNNSNDELIVTSEIGEGEYRKDYIYLNEWTSYVVEQLEVEGVSPYHYELRIIPKMLPVTEFEITD